MRGISLQNLPHRAIVAVTYTAPWNRWSTDLSLYYVGESGSPFTYRAWGENRRGDLNADGSNINDPIYVPRSALDTTEIRFSGISDSLGADTSATAQADHVRKQQNAFQRFIQETACLRRQRGRILERHSCREPWTHTMIAALRQRVPLGDRALEVELDAFNVLNMLSSRWGLYRIAEPRLLEHVRQTPGSSQTSQPIFRFNAARPKRTVLQPESTFQLQLAIRYRF